MLHIGNDAGSNLLDVSAIKKRIDANKSTLLSVVEPSDLLLTELVGECILDEPTQEEILAGNTRSEKNKRLFNWLSSTDEPLSFRKFLDKLRAYGQQHVANLLDGSEGELPLDVKARQDIQKQMGSLVKAIDLESGLLEALLEADVIDDSAYKQIKEQVKTSWGKKLMEFILRGSNVAFKRFTEIVSKTQPEVIDLIDNRVEEESKSHIDLIKKHHEILMRCTDVNPMTVAFLRSVGVIDGSEEDCLKSKSLLEKLTILYSWLRRKSPDTFKAYIKVMQDNEQKHVANLLTNSSSGDLPLSIENYKRLIKIRPALMKGMRSKGAEFMAVLQSEKSSEESDSAISQYDYETIIQKCVTDIERNCAVVDAVLRRTDFSYASFEKALRQTSQHFMADYLTQGIVVGIHVNTTRPEKDEDLATLLNKTLAELSLSESTPCDEQPLVQSLLKLNGFGIPLVAAESDHSIMMFTYCKTPNNARQYLGLLNSGQLQAVFEGILNHLLKILEPENFQPLEAAVTLEEKENTAVLEFTSTDGIETDADVPPLLTKTNCELHDNPNDIYCCDCDKFICSLCIGEGHQSHRHFSDGKITAEDLRNQLHHDLDLIKNYADNRIQMKTQIENEQNTFLKRVEESEKIIISKCDSLKERVEKFKVLLLQERAAYKEKVLTQIAYKKRAIESYLAVVDDYEKQTMQLISKGSPSDIFQQFSWLHKRAEKFQIHPTNMTGEITKEMLKKHESFLEEYMDPNSGLLDQLLAIGALDPSNLDEVGKLDNDQSKNKRLLEIVMNESKCDKLGIALTRSKQGHLVNYVCNNGEKKAEVGDIWPVMEDEKNVIDSMKEKLIFLFEIYDLLTLLGSMAVINQQQQRMISAKPTASAKCDTLLTLLKRGSLRDFEQVKSVVVQLNPMETLKTFLENYIDPDFGLLDEISTSLSKKEIKALRNERTLQKRNAKLLDIISHNKKYGELITALTNTNQTHIVNLLKTNGAYDPKFGEDWPLAPDEIRIIEANKDHLIDKLNAQNLLEKLLTMQVINMEQKEYIMQVQSRFDRNRALICILERGSLSNYRKTIECLIASNQHSIAQILSQAVPSMTGFSHHGWIPQQNFLSVTGTVPLTVNMTFVNTINKEDAELINSVNEVLARRYIP